MADIVNLRMVRKRKERAAGEAEAARNRAAHGRTKAEKTQSETLLAQSERRLDGNSLTSGKTDE